MFVAIGLITFWSPHEYVTVFIMNGTIFLEQYLGLEEFKT